LEASVAQTSDAQIVMEDVTEDCVRLPREILKFYTVKLHGSFQSKMKRHKM
jgi:hypothetical protein